jgi:transposase-like protein
MTQATCRDAIYRRRKFQSEIIELCVRWYITYRLSHRDLVAMMAERGILVSHTTIMRWVLRYVPEFEKRRARYARPVHSSWRVDETASTESRTDLCYAPIAASMLPRHFSATPSPRNSRVGRGK